MKINVVFEATGVEEAHDFDTKPCAGDLVTLTRDGKGEDYIVITEPNPDHNHDDGPDGHPTKATVRPA